MDRIYKGDIRILMPFFQAMEEGRTIQVKNGNDWIDIDGNKDGLNPDSLIGYQDCYRIKPEPKYRPFANAEECLKEMSTHTPFGLIKKNVSGAFYCIGSFDIKNIYIGAKQSIHSYADSLENFTFVDDTPFGVKLED